MGKDEGESKFGFKDQAKAEETLQLLLDHDMQYRKLTVRGLLGRAKRVLSMTKAADKVNNIKAAMTVFEDWLTENGGGQANKNAKTDSSEKVESVSGLGFKDKEAAEKTLQILDGRDPDYQKLAIKGLLGGSKRVLSGTKNEDKIAAIKEGIAILEDFLEKFDSENRSKHNLAYLPANYATSLPLATDPLAAEFAQFYAGSRVKGNYKHLRTLYPEDDDTFTWDIVRNRAVKELLETLAGNGKKLFGDDGTPTPHHLAMIYWAYSPQPEKVKTYIAGLKPVAKAEKRKSAPSSDVSSEDDSSSAEETPKKKQKK